jgi:Bcr/CflA subfamily drug resistance transporter
MSPPDTLTPPRDGPLLVAILLLSLVASLGSSLYVPSLPVLAGDFGVSAERVQRTISYYLFGLAGAQLLFGPMSDRYGRRVIVWAGLAVFLGGTLAGACAASWPAFVLGRVLQGIGASITSNAARTMMKDRFSGAALSRVAGYNGISLAIGLSVAPMIGALLQEMLGWRAGFGFMAVYAALLLGLSRYYLPETNLRPVESLALRVVARQYRRVLANPSFWANVMCATFASAGLNIFYSISPYLLLQRLGLSPLEYSTQMVVITVALILGRLVNAPLTRRFDWSGCLQWGNAALALAGGLMLAMIALWPSSSWSLLLPLAIFTLGAGLIFSNSVVGALQPFADIAGTAGAVYGCLQMALSALANLLFIRLPAEVQLGALAGCFVAFGLLGGLALGASSRRTVAPASA